MEDTLADFVVLPDLTNEVTESLVNVDALFCRCLDKFARKMFGEVTALCLRPMLRRLRSKIQGGRTVHAHLSLIFQITFVGDHNNGKHVLIFYS
jgi:hypothetical protein